MNISRKIQLAAAAVIANGALALTVLTPSTAFAACQFYSVMVCTGGVCKNNGSCPPPNPGCTLATVNPAPPLCDSCFGFECAPSCPGGQGYYYFCVYD